MRQAKDQGEWDEAVEVQVSDNTTCMRLTQSGTLLLPPLERAGSAQPIVPMGAVIEQLGYSVVWSADSCKLHPLKMVAPKWLRARPSRSYLGWRNIS